MVVVLALQLAAAHPCAPVVMVAVQQLLRAPHRTCAPAHMCYRRCEVMTKNRALSDSISAAPPVMCTTNRTRLMCHVRRSTLHHAPTATKHTCGGGEGTFDR